MRSTITIQSCSYFGAEDGLLGLHPVVEVQRWWEEPLYNLALLLAVHRRGYFEGSQYFGLESAGNIV